LFSVAICFAMKLDSILNTIRGNHLVFTIQACPFHCFVIETASVLIGMAMGGAKVFATPAGETEHPSLFAARKTSSFLWFFRRIRGRRGWIHRWSCNKSGSGRWFRGVGIIVCVNRVICVDCCNRWGDFISFCRWRCWWSCDWGGCFLLLLLLLLLLILFPRTFWTHIIVCCISIKPTSSRTHNWFSHFCRIRHIVWNWGGIVLRLLFCMGKKKREKNYLFCKLMWLFLLQKK